MSCSTSCCQKRCCNLWWALGLIVLFTLVLVILFPFFSKKKETDLEVAASKRRYELKAQTALDQEQFLSSKAIEAQIPKSAKDILSKQPSTNL